LKKALRDFVTEGFTEALEEPFQVLTKDLGRVPGDEVRASLVQALKSGIDMFLVAGPMGGVTTLAAESRARRDVYGAVLAHRRDQRMRGELGRDVAFHLLQLGGGMARGQVEKRRADAAEQTPRFFQRFHRIGETGQRRIGADGGDLSAMGCHGGFKGGRDMRGLNGAKGRQAKGRGPGGQQRVFSHAPRMGRQARGVEGLSVFSPSLIVANTAQITTNALTASIRAGVKKFIYMSSMARYGDHDGVQFQEDFETRPQDPYGIAKVAAEALVKNLSEVHGMEWVILVPHNIVGARQKFDDPYRNVASIFTNRMLTGLNPIIYGDGSQQGVHRHRLRGGRGIHPILPDRRGF
jgi:hypothetical protein